MFDIISNHKLVNFRSYASQSIEEAYQPGTAGVDMMEESVKGLFERNQRGLLIIEVGTVGTNGTLDIVIEDKAELDVGFSELCTLAQIDEAGLYYVDVKDFTNNVRLKATVATDAVSWGAKMLTFDALKRPVKQTDGTVLVATYATGR